jgi:hypothetical protein
MTPFGLLRKGMAPLFNFGIAPRASRGATAYAPRTTRVPLIVNYGGDIPTKLPWGCEPQILAYYTLPPSIAIQGQPAFIPPQLAPLLPNPYTRAGVTTG